MKRERESVKGSARGLDRHEHTCSQTEHLTERKELTELGTGKKRCAYSSLMPPSLYYSSYYFIMRNLNDFGTGWENCLNIFTTSCTLAPSIFRSYARPLIYVQSTTAQLKKRF